MVLDEKPLDRLSGTVLSKLPLREVLGKMKLNLLRVDAEGKVQEVHEGFCLMTGFSEEELIGSFAADLLFTKEDRDLMDVRAARREKGEIETYEVRIRGKDGRVIWVWIGGYPVYDDEGNFAGSIGIHLDITEKKDLERKLSYLNANLETEVERKLEEIMDLYRRMEGIQEEERRFLASELHDDLGHTLLVQKLEIEALGQEMEDYAAMMGTSLQMKPFSEKLHRIAEAGRSSIRKVRQLSHAIFPPELQFGTLVDAIVSRTDYLTGSGGIEFHIEVSPRFQDPVPQVKLLLYRAFQEAINNAIRHAAAKRIDVVLTQGPHGWIMSVANDVNDLKGSVESKSARGIGLRNLEERLRPWKGTLSTVQTDSGHFKFTIQIPNINHEQNHSL